MPLNVRQAVAVAPEAQPDLHCIGLCISLPSAGLISKQGKSIAFYSGGGSRAQFRG